jgi:hypothetical protein
MKNKKEKEVFLGYEKSLIYIIRAAFMSGEVSPGILHKATGVDIDTCIDFCAKQLGEVMFSSPPEV